MMTPDRRHPQREGNDVPVGRFEGSETRVGRYPAGGPALGARAGEGGTAMEDRQVWETPPASRTGERSSLTRRRVLEGGAALGAAGLVGTALLQRGGRVGIAQQPTGGDLDLVELALTLVALECDFDERGLEAGILSGRDLEVVTEVYNISKAQEKLIAQILADAGGPEVERAEFTFPDESLASRDGFLQLSSQLQELWVGGFQGMLPSIQNLELFNVGASLAGVRSRCAAAIAALGGGRPLPSPVETPLSAADVLNRVSEYRAA